MKYYFAPMEGITGYTFRNLHHKYFPGIDRYYAPFIAAGSTGNYKKKEIRDILPENNEGISLIPQILTNDVKAMIQTQHMLQELGYDEINLNLGCPSGTVTGKGRGSGFLKDTERLEDFLDQVFEKSVIGVSIKTRLGFDHSDEFYRILEIYERFPIKELIIHPRVRQDFYNNQPNLFMFEQAEKITKFPICYNGDLLTVDQVHEIEEKYPWVSSIMIGRGLLKNVGLSCELCGQAPMTKDKLYQFIKELEAAYKEQMQEENNVLFKMKELWFYLSHAFAGSEKYLKKIRKTKHLTEYEQVVKIMFEELDLA